MKLALLQKSPRLALQAETAAELMTPNPISVDEKATVREAVALLIDKGYTAAPVIDAAGRPVGVLSRTDILVHDRETFEHVPQAPEFYSRSELKASTGEPLGRGFQVEKVDRTRVRDLMTPAVFCVDPETPASKVIADLVGLNVHRLFVVDDAGVLVGVISSQDILRHLSPDLE
jgi:CBS domain-containing protein